VFGWRAGKEKPKPCASVFFIWRFIDQSRYATLRCDKMPLKVPFTNEVPFTDDSTYKSRTQLKLP
jgi:hypothetical protein